MQLKGRVYAEELQQMNEAGVAAQKYIADYLGVSEGQMLKMVEAGQIGVDQALTGIMTGMKEFDGIANEFANETVGGMLGQIGDALSSSVVRDWGEGLSKGLRPGLEYFQERRFQPRWATHSNHPHRKEVFPHIQSDLLAFQFVLIAFPNVMIDVSLLSV